MSKDIITMFGLFLITLLQLGCKMTCFGEQISGEFPPKTGIHKFSFDGINKEGNTQHVLVAQKDKYPHDSSTGVNYQTTKQGGHLNELSREKKTNIVSVNTQQQQQQEGIKPSIPRNLTDTDNIRDLHEPFKLKRFFNRNNPLIKWTRESTLNRRDNRHKVIDGLPYLRRKRSIFTPVEMSHQRYKRDLSGDTEVGLILGACVLGLLAAFLLICACVRCNAVRKSEDGKSTIPDYTPTLFPVAKGYDNVAFDTDDFKAESPSNEIPMIENVPSNGQATRTVSVA